MTYEQLRKHWPNASVGFLRANADKPVPSGLHPDKPQPVKRRTLERAASGETKGISRARICFTVYAVRPCDWDGYSIKELQDCLVHAGLLETDAWDQLEGRVVSKKVYAESEEKTVVTITYYKASE